MVYAKNRKRIKKRKTPIDVRIESGLNAHLKLIEAILHQQKEWIMNEFKHIWIALHAIEKNLKPKK